MNITQNKVVEIDYILRIDGEIIDQSEPGQPMAYLHGYEEIVAGLENALEGKQVGDSLSVTVAPADGYGERDDEALEVLDADDFEDELEIGGQYYAQLEDGSLAQFTVTSIEGDKVNVDFNHPLAGETLHFEVKVVGVRDASEEEIDHGHAHYGDSCELE